MERSEKIPQPDKVPKITGSEPVPEGKIRRVDTRIVGSPSPEPHSTVASVIVDGKPIRITSGTSED